MRRLIGLSFLISMNTWAAPQPVNLKPVTKSFHVQSEIEIDGQVVAKPNFIMLPNSRATLSETSDQRISRVELIAQDDLGPAKSDAIMMKFKIALIHNGEKKIHEPTVIARPNQSAELAVGDSTGKELFRMKVIAKREIE